MSSDLALLAVGGTIASVGVGKRFQPHLSAQELVERAGPPMDAAMFTEVCDLHRVVSSELSPNHMLDVVTAARHLVRTHDGVVITHGSATLAETAYLADLLWDDPIPLVVTGALLPSVDPQADGPKNIRDSALVAGSSDAVGQGSLVVANGYIHSAREVRKELASGVDAFSSGRYGTLGVIDEGTVVIYRRRAVRRTYEYPSELGEVAIVKAFSGMDGALLNCLRGGKYAGVVIEALPGRGGLPPALLPFVEACCADGLFVTIAGAVEGRLMPKYAGQGHLQAFLDVGALSAGDLRPEKVRLLLAVLLGLKYDRQRVQTELRLQAP